VKSRLAARVAARHGQVFIKTVVPAVIKPARTLWNEFIAFVFLCFAAMFGIRTAHLAMDYSKVAASDGLGALIRLSIAGACTAVMLWFGISSLLKARKISRS